MAEELSDQEFPKLSHPPLREALIDVRLRDELPVAVISQFRAPADFPLSKPMKLGQFQFKLEPDKPSQAQVVSEGFWGHRLEKADGSEVLQVRTNGLTYSILQNYPGWDVLKKSTQSVWQNFLGLSGSIPVSRLAVRYINAITIPAGADYDEYLTTGPKVPKSVPPIVSGFMQRVVVPFERDAATAVITQAMEGTSTAVLDIDIFADCVLEGSSPDVWSRLDRLRTIADRIFFSSLTEKVIASYQ
ncbi:MAG TPA: TIGR04255 family protein [Candidatus Acidoferrum sp.]|jgi:uncharacterized protein (TIGR04255 family)